MSSSYKDRCDCCPETRLWKNRHSRAKVEAQRPVERPLNYPNKRDGSLEQSSNSGQAKKAHILKVKNSEFC